MIVVVIDDQRTQSPWEAFSFEPTPRFVLLPIVLRYQHEDFFAITITSTITSKTSPFEGLSEFGRSRIPPAASNPSHLFQRLVQHNRNGVAEIQTADVLTAHRNQQPL